MSIKEIKGFDFDAYNDPDYSVTIIVNDYRVDVSLCEEADNGVLKDLGGADITALALRKLADFIELSSKMTVYKISDKNNEFTDMVCKINNKQEE